jgi:hypothetical protein
MPVGLADLLHEVAILHRFVDFLDEYCKEQERTQKYADASGIFFEYVENLAAGIKQELPQQIRRASQFPERLPILSSNMRTLKNYLRLLHVLIKPAADAHTLTTPAPLVDLASDQIRSIEAMKESKVVVLLASEFMYFQRPHTEIKIQGWRVGQIIPGAAFPHKLGFIELPYSQGPSFFMNLAIYHELAHFVYEEFSNSSVLHKGFAELKSHTAESLGRALGRISRDHQTFTFVLGIIENWTQEIFCDLFAIRLVGPAFSFSFVEMLGMLDFLSAATTNTFNPTHPAPAFRLTEHVNMLIDDGWWDAISDVNPAPKKILAKLARVPRSKYRFYLDEKEPGPQGLITVFLDVVVPKVRELVREITSRAACSAEQFRKDRKAIQDCLLAGVVPHRADDVPLHPTSIINSAFIFYLTSLPEVIGTFEGEKAKLDVEVYSKWTKRLEMWTMKAIEDSRLHAHFQEMKGDRNGPHKN